MRLKEGLNGVVSFTANGKYFGVFLPLMVNFFFAVDGSVEN